ncbi:cysteine synthase A [Candidatus Contubernalis alkaliaceticus]|uniref:cysteine synthase A n=1 Tax=Candidatus Contubernalis alkaliaceticus TaxID=338645 RepID=UPI001F4C4846|nr:cysteine synthase A [Candidatus Contubernalis alkalaceticus]UNC91787.1 cysteine synthase A [Candidatus Contubernalis alkalaceticus]
MNKLCKNILKAVGNTPLIQLQHLAGPKDARVLVKYEGLNIGGSIKTRTALGMIETAEKQGLLNKDSIIVEFTSGNQGIGLSLISAVKGYKCKIVMPENMSLERRKLIASYGAEIVLTPEGENIGDTFDIAREAAKKMAQEDSRVWLANQFGNPANPDIHRLTTAREIVKQAGGPIHAFCSGIGTGGTITGIGEVLKEHYPEVKIIAVEPEEAAVLDGGPIGQHVIQGMGDGIIPDILNKEIIDEIALISDKNALDTARALAREEGLLVGISSGANTWIALQLAKKLGSGKTVVTILPDTGERYLSTILFSSCRDTN